MNKKISPLSYYKIEKNVPQFELINFFLGKCSNNMKNYINSHSFYFNKNKPVFSIKQFVNYPDNIEIEYYFYKYVPERKHRKLVTIDKNFYKKEELEYTSNNLVNCQLYKNNEFIICSVLINDENINNGLPESNFYFGKDVEINDNEYPFYTLKENINGNVIKILDFANIFDVISYDNFPYYYLDKIIEYEKNISYCINYELDTECICIEDLRFEGFLKFLSLCNYSLDFYNFCIKNYDTSFEFSVSYEINRKGEILKSSIYGILFKHH